MTVKQLSTMFSALDVLRDSNDPAPDAVPCFVFVPWFGTQPANARPQSLRRIVNETAARVHIQHRNATRRWAGPEPRLFLILRTPMAAKGFACGGVASTDLWFSKRRYRARCLGGATRRSSAAATARTRSLLAVTAGRNRGAGSRPADGHRNRRTRIQSGVQANHSRPAGPVTGAGLCGASRISRIDRSRPCFYLRCRPARPVSRT